MRCNEGRAIEVFDLAKRELVRHVPFNARVADVAIAPDGKQAIVALPAEGSGFVGIVNLENMVGQGAPGQRGAHSGAPLARWVDGARALGSRQGRRG